MFVFMLFQCVASNAWLNDHNYYRCLHDTAPFTYSMNLQKYAEDWCPHSAKLIKVAGRPPRLKLFHEKEVRPESPGAKFGENLSISGSSVVTALDTLVVSSGNAASGWYIEIEFWENGEWSPASGFVDTPMIGHMTQMLWKGTTEVGCARCHINSSGTAVVCKYNAHGNVSGRFPQNLPASFGYSDNTKIVCASKFRGSGGSSPETTPKTRPRPRPTTTATPPAPPTTTETITTTTTDKATAECKCSEDSSCVLFKKPGDEWHDSQFCKVNKSDACNDLRYDAKDNSYSRIPCATTEAPASPTTTDVEITTTTTSTPATTAASASPTTTKTVITTTMTSTPAMTETPDSATTTETDITITTIETDISTTTTETDITTTTTATAVCTKAGFVRHHKYCNKFYQCVQRVRGYRAYEKDCGPGTAFNDKTNNCDWPYNVDGCDNGDSVRSDVSNDASESRSVSHTNDNSTTITATTIACIVAVVAIVGCVAACFYQRNKPRMQEPQE
eukprot:GEMP01015536.1.p1 GENE.GEMP01015536.1~~GEMP01015536.1.p1  ORF type:complete len:504 (-),score=55.44 GEMP01015536.1:1285-2796(-)